MKKLFLSIFFTTSIFTFAQVRYSGTIDKYPIELVAAISSTTGNGVYAYKKYNVPIYLDAKIQNGLLIFTEKDQNGKEAATLTFKNAKTDHDLQEGIWKDLKTGK